MTRVYSSFSLVGNRELLEGRRTADVISVTSQSQPFQNYQQPIACFVLYGSRSRQMALRKSFRHSTKAYILPKNFHFIILYKTSRQHFAVSVQ